MSPRCPAPWRCRARAVPEPRGLRRALGLSRRSTIRREVDDELAFHLEMRTRQLESRGLSPEDAAHEARRQFGDVERVRASCVTHDQERLATMQRASVVDELRRDLAFAVRTATRYPLFTVLVALTIAVGVGANTAIFSLVNAVLLRRLPVPAPGELVVIGNPGWVGAVMTTTDAQTSMFSWQTYRTLVDRTTSFTGLAASGRANRLSVRTEAAQGEADRPRGRFVSGNYFTVLGVGAQRGRVFDGSEDAGLGGAPAVVISHWYWTNRLASDPRVVGRELLVNGARFTIIGVTPPEFLGEVVGQRIDLYLPVSMNAVVFPNDPYVTSTQARWLHLIGRRRSEVTPAQALSRTADEVRATLAEEFSLSGKEKDDLVPEVHDGSRGLSRLRENFGEPLVILLAGVAVLLLLICANVANLLLSRAMARGREMSVRLAIGAGRARLVRQLLMESTVLGLLGAAGGMVLARWGSQGLVALTASGPAGAPPLDLRPDGTVLLFTATLCVVTVLLFGLVPAWRTSQVDLASALRAGARSLRGSGGGRWSLGNVLIVAQVALSLVLIVGASLLVRSLQQVSRVETGLDRDHLAILQIDARSAGYTEERLRPYSASVLDALRRVPGVSAVTWSANGIFSGSNSQTSFTVPGFVASAEDDSSASYDQVAAGYVQAIGGRLLRGRDFTEADIDGRAPVMLINETMARFYFGAADPIGRSIRLNDSLTSQIVGVVGDVRDRSLREAADRRFYLPALGGYDEPANFVAIVRTTGDPARLLEPLRAAVRSIDAGVDVDAEVLSALMAQSVREERMLAQLSSAFGMLALLLASLGLYGVMSYAVSRRTSEIGVRAALGASGSRVTSMVLRDALWLVGAGMVIGIPGGVGAGQLLRASLHGVAPADPVSLGVGLAVLLLCAVTAALVPALRAARVSPMVALQRD